MRNKFTFLVLLLMLVSANKIFAQEAETHHGFIFYGGKYTMDEEKFRIYAEGHEFATLIHENPKALQVFHCFERLHKTANVMTGLFFVGIAFGGMTYIPGLKDELPDNTGLISFGTGGGLLILGLICEFVSWTKLSRAAKIYNKEFLIDDQLGWKFKDIPKACVKFNHRKAQLALSWRF